MSANKSAKQRSNPHGGLLANLAFNLIIPTLILTKLGKEEYLGPSWAIVIALAFPIIYGLRDFSLTHKPNVFSILGVISITLTGGISLLQLDPQYIAIKEAAIPGLLGLATLISLRTPFPLVKTFLFNEQIMQVDKITEAARQRGTEPLLEKRLRVATYLIACSFFLSSLLNYLLAQWILVSPPGTTEFTEELGKMTALSFPVIALPSMVVMTISLIYLFVGIEKFTELKLEDILQQH